MKLRPGLLIAVLLVMLVAVTSCRRDYVCRCEISYSGQPGLPDTLYRDYHITDTKDIARSLCEANSSETEKEGVKTVETCYLY